MQEEMEDLRLSALAFARLETLEEKKVLSHAYIQEKCGR